MGKDFNCMSMVRNDIKCKYMFMFPLKNLAHKVIKDLNKHVRKCQCPLFV